MRTVNPEKAEARRRQILDAAEACFRAKGFHATSIAEICGAAKISAGGLYRYFASKEEIIAAMADEERVEAARLLGAVAESNDFFGALDALLDRFAEVHNDRSSAALTAELLAEAVRNEQFATVARQVEADMIKEIARMLQAGQRKGDVDPTLDPCEAAGVLLAAADGLGMRLVILGGYDGEKAVSALRTLTRRYLQNPHRSTDLPVPANLSGETPNAS